MSILSDTHRSDTATVCSGSVVGDIEVESDNHSQTSCSASCTGSTKKTVEFTSEIQTPVVPMSGISAGLAGGVTSPASFQTGMGPPLSRTLLMQKADDLSASRANSVKSFDSACDGSLDVETHSLPSPGDLSAGMKEALAKSPAPDSVKSFETHSHVDSVVGNAVDVDDSCNSLDVETHSIGTTRSIQSQEFRSIDVAEVASSNSTPVDESALINLLCSGDLVPNGRCSPGGTIYRGKGVRRYQGRYMHLSPKRFHCSRVYLDSAHEDPTSRNSGPHAFESLATNARAPMSSLDRPLKHPRNNIHNDHIMQNQRKRNGSRSRSPSPARANGERASSPQYRRRYGDNCG